MRAQRHWLAVSDASFWLATPIQLHVGAFGEKNEQGLNFEKSFAFATWKLAPLSLEIIKTTLVGRHAVQTRD